MNGMIHGRDHVKIRKIAIIPKEIDQTVIVHLILIRDHEADRQIQLEVHTLIVQDPHQGIFFIIHKALKILLYSNINNILDLVHQHLRKIDKIRLLEINLQQLAN